MYIRNRCGLQLLPPPSHGSAERGLDCSPALSREERWLLLFYDSPVYVIYERSAGGPPVSDGTRRLYIGWHAMDHQPGELLAYIYLPDNKETS